MSTTNIGMTKFRLDPENPPTMAEEQLQALRDLRDEDIDLSDIPDQSGKTGWRRASQPVMALIPEENKQQITLRLDAEVLAFFKSTGKRYQSRINAALREYMNSHSTEIKSR
ncbi:BrnA antitoxin family protein [Acidicapsa ligni]|uniref:BrnA antitoxin family protein n=1 Tax=Acidicapsa ligni TaxID=542300 RepID=UPI0021DF6A7A|nr:BrnA antitoxin family protein [Acidicapsa ligni]